MNLPRWLRQILHQTNLRFDPEFCLSAPLPASKTKKKKEKSDNSIVLKSGVHITKQETGDPDNPEWINTTADIGKDTTRNPVFTRHDAEVLEQDKYTGLEQDKYKILKQVWADNISAQKAGQDYRVKNLDGVGRSIRTLYWSAFSAAHKLEIQAGEKLAKATV